MRPALAELQQRFLEAVLDDAPLEGIAPADALDVYRRNVRANLHAALAAAYPVVRRLVGDAFFAQAARRHGEFEASTSGDLHGYGAGFAAFLEGYGPARTLDYLGDVARLEWAVHESFHAADPPSFDFEALARIAPQRHGSLRLRLAPAVRLVASKYPVLAIWHANQPHRDGTPDRSEGPDRIVVRREGFEVVPQAVDREAWRFLDRLRQGASLGRAAEALGPAQERLPSLLAEWIRAGVVASFETTEDSA